MLRKIRESICIKLFILLAAVVVMAVVPITFSTLHSLHGYGAEALTLHGDHVLSRTLSSLQRSAREKAARYQEHFDRIAVSAAMLGGQASAIYAEPALYAGEPLPDASLVPPLSNISVNDSCTLLSPRSAAGASMSPDIDEERRALSHLAPLLKRVLLENPEGIASHAFTSSGIGLYCTTAAMQNLAARGIPSASVFAARHEQTMALFHRGERFPAGALWTELHQDAVTRGLILTASAPIHNGRGQLVGTTGVDVPLATVVDEMLITEGGQDSAVLFSFLLDADSKIIAFPQQYHALFGLEAHAVDRPDLFLHDSINDEIVGLANNLSGTRDYQQKIALNGESYYAIISSMPKKGWRIGVVARENDILQTVHASRSKLASTISEMALRSVVFSLVTVAIAIAVVFLLLKHLINPLRRLSRATERVAAGDYEVQCPVSARDELGMLARSFNSMVLQLRSARKEQERYSEYLEKEVAKRNVQVTMQKQELENSVKRLQEEMHRRQIVSEKLRKQGEELHKSLQEKEVLLREIHHRIKNNMLIIISMLELQRQDIEGERQRDIFREMENRIRSMALVHEKLYASNSISRIDMGSYLHDIAMSLLSSMVIDGRIALDLQAEPISIDIDHAIPIGLVINEIITNSIKHAFPEGRRGTIFVAVKWCENDRLLLTVADDGIGLPEHVDILRSTSFGTGIIIAGLVKMQLKGELSVDRQAGTKYTIRFLDPILHKRL